MRIQFKLLILMLLPIVLFAQEKSLYKEVFDVNEETTMILNLNNTSVFIESSNDDKVHIDFNLNFKGFSNKEIKVRLKDLDLDLDGTMFKNHITLTAHSLKQISHIIYEYNAPNGLVLENNIFSNNNSSKLVKRKSKDSIVKAINFNNTNFLFEQFKIKNKEGKLVNVPDKFVKRLEANFYIKIPSYVNLSINAENAWVNIKGNINNELSVNLTKGAFKAKRIANKYNKIKVDKAGFKVEEIIGGNYTLNNVTNGLIASLENVTITSEFSKIEIGEIKENNSITDFTSTYWFYNWSNNFKRFDLFSEYSKIHFFYPVKDHSLKVFGNNTKNILDNGAFEIDMQPTSSGEKYHMMQRKPKGEGQFSGAINFDIVHGIIYSHNDSIKKINK